MSHYVDNQLTPIRAVMVACLMAIYKIDFVWIIFAEIHEMAL